jgi:hypothetical protein
MQQNAGLLTQRVSKIIMPIFKSTYISEYRFLVSKPASRLDCVAQGC